MRRLRESAGACFSRVPSRDRNRTERFFNRIGIFFRRTARRYERRASNDLALLKSAASQLWQRRHEPMS